MSAENILKLIEDMGRTHVSRLTTVADGTRELFVLDAMVWLYSGGAAGWTIEELKQDDEGRHHVVKMQGRMSFACPNFTGSRDAIMKIRPPGWYMEVEPRFFCDFRGYGNTEMGAYVTACKAKGAVSQEGFHNLKSPLLRNEYLAELHATVQAIEFEKVKS